MARRLVGSPGISAPKENTDRRLEKYGVRRRNALQEVPRYVGERSGVPFSDVFAEELQLVLAGSAPPVLGRLYARGEYAGADGSRAYEPVYSDAAYPQTAQAAALREFYLETDLRSDVNPAEGDTTSAATLEVARGQFLTQVGSASLPEETLTSVRAVGDDDADIEVFA